MASAAVRSSGNPPLTSLRHVLMVLSTVRYAFSWLRFNYYGGMARFSYRFAFLAAATTYGIVVYKTFKARAKAGARNPSPIGLLADENVQYLGAFTPRPRSFGRH